MSDRVYKCNFQARDIPVLVFSAGLADIIEEVSSEKNGTKY